MLRIFREEVKPGMGEAHEKVEANYVHAVARAKFPVHYLALSSLSGTNEVWFVEAHDSYASIEKAEAAIDKLPALKQELGQIGAQDGGLLTGGRTLTLAFREGLSYRPGVNVAQMRYFSVNTIRVRPGHDPEFREARGIIKAALEKANADAHFAVYQVVLGAPAGTYIVFTPRKSLAELDAPPNQAIQAALGEEGQKKLRELASAYTQVSEPNLFAFSPKMSYPPKEFVAADAAFWAPKPKVTAKPAAAKKEVAKAGTTP